MSAYSTLILSHASLRAYFRLAESTGTTLVDAGPNGLSGTYASSGITYAASGAIAADADTAVTFDATSDPATVPDNNALDLGDGPFSVEFWVKRSATQGANQTILNKGTNAYLVRFNTNDRMALLKSGGSTIASTPAITDQLYHHVVITKDGGTTLAYLDGVDVTFAGTAGTLADTANSLRIGHASPAGARFPGTLDELAIYGAVLSATEVRDHYDRGRGVPALAASATAAAPTPALSISLAAPAAGATAAAPVSVVGVTVSSPAASATASATAPGLAVQIVATAAQSSATAAAPSVRLDRLVTAPVASATAVLPVPTLGLTIAALSGAATSSATAPALAVRIASSVASAMASFPAPAGSGIPGYRMLTSAGHRSPTAPGKRGETSPGYRTPASPGHRTPTPPGHRR